MWTKDIPTPIETGKAPGNEMYGVHPFYMFKRSQAIWVGVLHKLANAQDWHIKNDPINGFVSLSTYSTGGVGDITIMTDSTPDRVLN